MVNNDKTVIDDRFRSVMAGIKDTKSDPALLQVTIKNGKPFYEDIAMKYPYLASDGTSLRHFIKRDGTFDYEHFDMAKYIKGNTHTFVLYIKGTNTIVHAAE